MILYTTYPLFWHRLNRLNAKVLIWKPESLINLVTLISSLPVFTLLRGSCVSKSITLNTNHYLEASESKWVNLNDIWYGFNSLRLGVLHWGSYTSKEVSLSTHATHSLSASWYIEITYLNFSQIKIYYLRISIQISKFFQTLML